MSEFDNFVQLVKSEFEREFPSITKAAEEPSWFDEAVKSKYGMTSLVEDICDRIADAQPALVLAAILEEPDRFLYEDFSEYGPTNLKDAMDVALRLATLDELEEYLDERFYGQFSNLSGSDVKNEISSILERLEGGVQKNWDSLGRKLDLHGKYNQSERANLQIFCRKLAMLKDLMRVIDECGWDLSSASKMESLSLLAECFTGYRRQEGDEEILSRLVDLSGYICHRGEEIFPASLAPKNLAG